MLSYQHSYHAGNHGDVLKHLVLVQCLRYLQRKDKPLCYIDTHAGRGDYDLASIEANKTGESQGGIDRIIAHADQVSPPPAVVDYLAALRASADMAIAAQSEATQFQRYYPGSCRIASALTRATDRLFCYDLHPQEYEALKSGVGRDRRVRTKHADGFEGCISLLPPKERRALVLIDPSYEIKADYERVFQTITSSARKFSTGVYLAWLPLLGDIDMPWLTHAARQLRLPGTQLHCLQVAPTELARHDRPDRNSAVSATEKKRQGMAGSVMLCVNAPYILGDAMTDALAFLAAALGPGATTETVIVSE